MQDDNRWECKFWPAGSRPSGSNASHAGHHCGYFRLGRACHTDRQSLDYIPNPVPSVPLHVYNLHLHIMTAPLSLSNARYLIPNWFLERNVKTAAELSVAPDQIIFCTCGDCKETKADDDGEGTDLADEACPERDKAVHDVDEDSVKEVNDSWSSSPAREQCPDEIKYKTFAELRDITAATFAIDRDGKLLRPKGSAVIFRMEKE